MGRAIPRFLLSKSTQSKSKGTFIIHTLDPQFIAEPEFDEIRQIIDCHIVEVFQGGTLYSDKAREIADKEIPTWWRYSGIHDSSDLRDKIIASLSKFVFLSNVEKEFTVEEAQEVLRIIFPTKAKNLNRSVDSYGIKHDFERISMLFNSGGKKKYCNNETIKKALAKEGFRTKQDSEGSPNVVANISEAELKLIRKIGFYRVNNIHGAEPFIIG